MKDTAVSRKKLYFCYLFHGFTPVAIFCRSSGAIKTYQTLIAQFFLTVCKADYCIEPIGLFKIRCWTFDVLNLFLCALCASARKLLLVVAMPRYDFRGKENGKVDKLKMVL